MIKKESMARNKSGELVMVFEFYGLSTDSKPTAPLGSTFWEIDTAKLYMSDGTNWNEQV